MPVDNTDDGSFLTRAPIKTLKPSYQYAATNSSSSRYNPITDSTSAIYPSYELPAALTPHSNSHKKTEYIQEGVKKIRSECSASSYTIYPSAKFSAACS